MKENISSLELAFLGDAYYELYIRTMLLNKDIRGVNNLQKETEKYVKAEGQKKFLNQLLEENYLKEEEVSIYKRGRNAKISHHHKDLETYKISTGLEALIGYLYLNDSKRLKEIMEKIK